MVETLAPGSRVRDRIEAREFLLSPLAAKSRYSRGRLKPEPPSPTRGEFQRDRDRVVHSKAFRRLKHKTQVFIAPLGDHYVTRLTHTMEVAQVARTIARALNLNEDVAEAIALAHDLGHPPFGHAGEEALNKLLPGGFRHNAQSLRVVDHLERDGNGLNLTWETRGSIATHSKPRESIASKGWGVPPTLEGQVCKIADAVAYLNHDIGDAVRARLLREGELPLLSRDVLGTTHAQRIDTMVTDIVQASWEATRAGDESRGQTAEQYREVLEDVAGRAERGDVCVQMTPRVQDAVDALREFMFQNVYEDSDAKDEVQRAQDMLGLLFRHYLDHPDRLPPALASQASLEQRVADWIAGMTDQYAIQAFEEAYLPKLWSAH